MIYKCENVQVVMLFGCDGIASIKRSIATNFFYSDELFMVFVTRYCQNFIGL